jgi:hypothetical protein
MPFDKGTAMSKGKELDLVGDLKKAIRSSGQSLTQLGRVCNVNPAQLSRFMRGERGLTLRAAGRICEALRLRLTSEGPPEQPRKSPRKRK